jgi:hypothetical protein
MLASSLSENLPNGKGVEVRLRSLRDELGAGKAEGFIHPQEEHLHLGRDPRERREAYRALCKALWGIVMGSLQEVIVVVSQGDLYAYHDGFSLWVQESTLRYGFITEKFTETVA